MPFLKSLSFGKSRHKKLPEEWGSSIKQPVNDGMSFYVKYLGSTLVDKPSDEAITAEAIKAIIAMAKLSGKKLKRVTLTVKPSGLMATDVSNGNVDIDVSIYRISYCSADATFERVVAFIATNKNETLECHAFLTSKRKIAQAAALTISQAFTIAFEKWQESKSDLKSKSKPDVNSNSGFSNNEAALIDLSSEPPETPVNVDAPPETTPNIQKPLKQTSKSKGTNNFKERFDEDDDLDASFFMLAKSRAETNGSSASGVDLLPNNVTKGDFDPHDLNNFLSSNDSHDKDDVFFSSDTPDDLFNL